MQLVLTTLAFLLAALSAAPQSTTTDPRFTVKMEVDPEYTIESKFTITNQSQIPITAVLIACDSRVPPGRPPGYVRYRTDSLIGDSVQILYQESTILKIHRPDFVSMTCKQDFSVRAVLFSDGSSFGESTWVDEILQRRRSILQSTEELLSFLQNAKNSGTTKAQLTAQLRKLDEGPFLATMPDHTIEPEGTPSIYYDVSRNLLRDRDNPKDSPVSQSFVDELSAPLLDQRQLLLYAKPAIPGLPQDLDPAAAPPPDITIKFPDALGSEDDASIGNMISVFYTLNAKGQKEKSLYDRFSPGDEDTLKIHALVAGHPASSVKVAIYAPGCQIKIINVADPSAYSGREIFQCVKLPTIKFSGQILSSDLLFGKKYAVQIMLHNPGDDETPWFDVYLSDDTTVDESGIFHIDMPDFSQDPVCSEHGVTLQFFAGQFPVDIYTIAILTAQNGSADSEGNLRLVSDYGGPVTFQPQPKKK
ncbi:MAG TPA: hypothetical protein VIH72_08760 [Candidatus Acidoferrales bacterium]|jgi:hypothetical protein